MGTCPTTSGFMPSYEGSDLYVSLANWQSAMRIKQFARGNNFKQNSYIGEKKNKGVK